MPRPATAAARPPVARSPEAHSPTRAELSEARMKQLAAEYRSSQSNNSSKASSEAAVLATIRKTEASLRAKHQGKDIDFQVIERDGRTMLKPIVR